MRRLFWKFFLTIWLTVTVSVVGLFAISTLLRIDPFPKEVEQAKRDFAAAVMTELRAERNFDAANAFAKAASQAFSAARIDTDVDPSTDRFLQEPDSTRGSILDWLWPRLIPWVAIALAAALSAYSLTRSLVRPIAQLRNGLSALAHGRFDVRIRNAMDGRRDEIAELVTDFDATAKRLEEFRLSQRRLFSDVSHELRSPLTRLQASLGVIEQNPARSPAMMERISREIERMDGLIGEILTLARLADGQETETERQTLDLIDLLQEIIVDAAFEAQARDVRIELLGPDRFIAKVNGELIYRAFENVIRNAVKYTAQGTLITVVARIEGEILRLRVTDQGPGLQESELEWIFEPFSRSQSAERNGGYGLGLAIAKQAVESHGGRIAASLAEAGGLAVTLEVPSCS